MVVCIKVMNGWQLHPALDLRTAARGIGAATQVINPGHEIGERLGRGTAQHLAQVILSTNQRCQRHRSPGRML